MPTADDDNKNEQVAVTTVARTILGLFFDALQKTEDLKDIGKNLRKLVMDDGIMAEPSIRKVLFSEEK